jgi:hypothetical protein
VIVNRPARWASGVLALALVLVGALVVSGRGDAAPAAEPPVTRSVLFVGNNWDGTADIVDPKTFA